MMEDKESCSSFRASGVATIAIVGSRLLVHIRALLHSQEGGGYSPKRKRLSIGC